MTTTASTTTGLADTATLPREILRDLWVVVVGGIPFGVLVAGLGSRLAMFFLRLTSPERVIGLTSDDGFTIGVVSLGGTYNLMLLGAAVGVIGAGAYLMVAPWLIGPDWFRALTVGLASAVVVGSMLVHADGIDFNVLKPKWFAIGLFIALPGIFGLTIGPWISRMRLAAENTRTWRTRWLLPALLIAAFPFVIFPFVFVALAVIGLHVVGSGSSIQRIRALGAYGLIVRMAWLGVAGLGLIALIEDIRDLS